LHGSVRRTAIKRFSDNPDKFKPERTPNPHIGFGKGIHYCLGAPFAKLETQIALSVIFDRAQNVEFSSNELEPFYSGSLNGLKSFPVTVTPP
jgi:cytochrome P450